MHKILTLPDAHREGVNWDLVSDAGEFAIFRRETATRRGFTHSTRSEIERHADLEWARGRLSTVAGHYS